MAGRAEDIYPESVGSPVPELQFWAANTWGSISLFHKLLSDEQWDFLFVKGSDLRSRDQEQVCKGVCDTWRGKSEQN